MTTNTAFSDELEAVNSIYDAETLSATSDNGDSTTAVLKLPNLPFSFSITFSHDYPDVPPQINGTQSTGPNTRKGEGEAALNVLREVLGNIYTPGQVCIFDLIEEVNPLLQTSPAEQEELSPQIDSTHNSSGRDGPSQNPSQTASHRSAAPASSSTTSTLTSAPFSSSYTTTTNPITDLANLHIKDLHSNPSPGFTAATSIPEPNWSLSQPLLVSKSSFVARALEVHSVRDATDALSHLLSTNKKVAGATHNITAWRMKSQSSSSSDTAPEIVVQDCDDDGETAAGGTLLHLMQLMDVWNVVVVVTRWYGGVKLGPDRFRCVNVVARDALVRGGFAREEAEGTGSKGKGGKKK